MTQGTLRPTRKLLLLGAMLTMGLLSACSWIPKGDARFDVGITDRGVASWYGAPFHGRQAANGEIYDMEALTAAHRTMPLGSIVRVANLTNGKHVHVRITDRGPYAHGRILDLSHAAAVTLAMEQGGLAIIEVEIVGERDFENLIASDIAPARLFLLHSGLKVIDERESPVLTHAVRALPGDIWLIRRARRISAMLAADHPAHTEVAALALS